MIYIKKTMYSILGITFFILGIISLVIPIFPGATLFLFVSMTCFTKVSERIANIELIQNILMYIEKRLYKMRDELIYNYRRLSLKYNK